MNPTARDRLFGFQHAFDQPVVIWLVVFIAILLAATAAVLSIITVRARLSAGLRSELWKRYLTWLAIVPLITAPILFSPAATILLVGVLSLLCYREFARATGLFRERAMSLIVVLGIAGVTFASLDHWYGLFAALGPLTLIAIATTAILYDHPKGYVQRVGLASLSFMLFGVCLGHLGYLANDPGYRGAMLALLVCIGMNDIFAFVVGKSIGGPKLAPRTSPNKTIAGSVGAAVLTTALFVVIGGRVFEGTPVAAPLPLAILGLIISVSGQLGDLMISSVKRDVGIKDMGAVLPGHGGVLDRCNSLLLSAPAVFHFIGYFQGVGLHEPVRVFTGP